MLTWVTVKIEAYHNGYTYTITQGDEGGWVTQITTPDGGVDYEVHNTIEEAKDYCENTAANIG